MIIFFGAAMLHAKIYERSVSLMSTEVEIRVYYTEDKAAVETSVYKAIDEIKRLDEVMSSWYGSGILDKINRSSGKGAVKVPAELFNVIAASIEVSKVSGGAFDITVGKLLELWSFDPDRPKLPSLKKIKNALKYVDYKRVKLDREKKTVYLEKEGMQIGLGGIAKGYIVDKASKQLYLNGLKDFIVKAGGDMRVQGKKGSEEWEIAIKDPRRTGRPFLKLPLSNVSISTSGDYERYFINKGKRYHHILDPRTGYPSSGCRSVSVIASDTMTSDALSTCVFVLGPEEGLDLIEHLNGTEVIIIDSGGDLLESSGIIKK